MPLCVAVFDESVIALMGSRQRPRPRELQLELCKRHVHTRYKAVELEIAKRFKGAGTP